MGDVQTINSSQQNQINILKDQYRETMNKLKKDQAQELEKVRTEHEKKLEQEKIKYRKKEDRIELSSQKKVDRIKEEEDRKIENYRKAGRAIKEKIYKTHSQKLGEIKSIQSDPFYKLIISDLEVEETPNAYIAKVNVPEHELDNVRVSVQDGLIKFTGTRSNEIRFTDEKTDKDISSRNYNSFFEALPIKRKVDLKNIQRNYDNGVLRVHIPKV